jgi:diguanylate cyclase (GGDEF)-like protein/PAS domain S-box-containing protein
MLSPLIACAAVFSGTPWNANILIPLLLLIVGQQLWIYLAHRRSSNREELFRIITENAADMIALVDTKSHRLYNSPAYEKILGYSPQELAKTPIFEQIHPDDRFKVLEAAREARATGVGKSLQYRLRHKNGEWRILESTASTIKNQRGEVEKLVIVNRDVTRRVETEAKLAHHTLHDSLTGLPNRRLFLDRLQRCFTQAQRDPNFRYALLLVDVDAFKALNHSMGAAAGDQVLVEVGIRLQASLRATDAVSRPREESAADAVLARLGGDEFVILLEPCADPSDVLRIAERIHAAIAAPLILEQGEVHARVSIGSALSAPQPERADDPLGDAETALRRAQAMGGSRSELFDPAMHNRAVTRLQLESDLRTALNRGQFRVLYQPVFQMHPWQVVGFEALLRWQHPAQGLISPREFLDAAEDTGLMALIDQWVIREACRNLPLWESASGQRGHLHLAVNLSARHFASPQLLDGIKACLHDAQIQPGTLQLGITERIAMANPDLTAGVLSQLKRLDLTTAIDDFGAGSISLVALRRFSPDIVKIDRSLVTNMQADRASKDVVDLILTLARKLNCQVVAQGIEKPAQLDHLRSLGCNFAQGYLFASPIDPDATQRLLRDQARSHRASPASAG